ncbi:cytochrome c [Fulvimonas soli]|uniref:Cytochrome c n=1 Tax=Fulvimonas soli TaxID=155197 RepID=A0A316IXI6_9GAMM|nr:cytochrome c [Fulvimonas soli]PWK91895.1 cytochrome c' [Fulvimonas soli]TNY26022.1 cytochrome C [Fulvimonas soli]
MRAALLIVLGLAIGIVGTVFTMNALHERDPLPHAVMHLMAFHAGQLKQELKAQRCDAGTSQHHLVQLQAVSSDIAAAFAGADEDFIKAADKLHAAVNGAVQSAPADCPALAAASKPINEACQSCHEQYR